MSKSYTGNCL